jgi:hypothetical protein
MTALSNWFDALEARGEDVEILIGRSSDLQPAEWTGLSHVDYDGVGAIGLQLSRRAGKRVALPVRSSRDPGRPLCFVEPTLELMTRVSGWRPQRLIAATAPEVLYWSVEELAALREAARVEESSIGSCLFWGAHEALVEETGSDRVDDGLWMLPINLRSNPLPLDYRGNYASFVAAAPGGGSIGELHDQLADRLARGEQWANARWLAKFAAHPTKLDVGINMLDATATSFLGLFTNFGEWNVPELGSDRWCIAGPPTRMTPIIIAAVCVNGTLAMTARSVMFGSEALQRLLHGCRAAVLGR